MNIDGRAAGVQVEDAIVPRSLATPTATMVTSPTGDDRDLARSARPYDTGLLAWDGGIHSLWYTASAGTAPAIP